MSKTMFFEMQSRLLKYECVLNTGSVVLIGGNMKTLRSLLVVLAISAAAVSTASARDSFSIDINVGGYGYDHGYYAPPAVRYYSAPPVVYAPYGYYAAPRVVYSSPYYYAPRASFGYQYYDNGHHHHGNRGWNNRGHRDHDRRGHR